MVAHGHSIAGDGPGSTPKDGRSSQAASGIVTPLLYGDALALAEQAISAASGFLVRDRVAKALLALDVASRQQAQEPLISGIAALGMRADEQGDQVSRRLAAHLIAVARGEELPAAEPPSLPRYDAPDGK